MPALSVIPPPHVRSTGAHEGWLLRNAAVRSVTSILLPSFPTKPQGTGTHASRKSQRRYHSVGVSVLSRLSLFWSHCRIPSERGTLSSSEWDINAKAPF
ncbi:hypothetical protein QQF64_002473 [Cirrhinus molitorella]|uniref:Uncharacterized protein n=1 Tax=Cirrhinus molitorella TaxID=172907 RepID=A0ABR3MQA4_9TELE